jgi:hypothetical protein
MGSPYIFEVIMLICFGLAWPVSIYKSYKARSNAGKSVHFLYIILLGYASGIVFQYLLNRSFNYVFIFFFINSLMVIADIGLYYRNGSLNKF